MTPKQRKAFEYWSERIPGSVAALRSTVATIETLDIPEVDKRRTMESVAVLLTTVATDIDRLHGETEIQRGKALSSLLGSVFETHPGQS